MKVVLLSGGSGTRLWPMSTEDCPKQFVSFFDDDESMLYSTYKKVNNEFSSIYVATQQSYTELIKKQINNKAKFIIEPNKIGAVGAIFNIAAYFKYKEGLSDEEIISVVPTDHEVENDFYKVLNDAYFHIKNNNENICLVGIKPTFASTEYGYILHKNNKVEKFLEKPNEVVAKELISKNVLWNSGIIVFKLGYIIEISKRYLSYNNYEEFKSLYNTLPRNNFEKEVLEKENNIGIIESKTIWNDLGTWEVLSSKISTPDKFNTNIINLEDKEIRNNGVRNAIIINSKNGISLINKNIEQIIWRDWGYYKIIEQYNGIELKYLNIFNGNNVSFKCDENIEKTLFISKGECYITIDNETIKLTTGSSVNILKGQIYLIKVTEDIQIIEVTNKK